MASADDGRSILMGGAVRVDEFPGGARNLTVIQFGLRMNDAALRLLVRADVYQQGYPQYSPTQNA